MPQYRLTAKMAAKLKITNLNKPPSNALPFYDDWVVDLDRYSRKETAIFMHVGTRIVLAVPIYEIGGIKELFDCFPAVIEWGINELCIDGYEDFGSEIRNYFEPDINEVTFYKTDNRSVTTQLNQFKEVLAIDVLKAGHIDHTICNKSSEYWQEALITNPHTKKEYTRPIKLWASYLSDDVIESESQDFTDNVLDFPAKRTRNDS